MAILPEFNFEVQVIAAFVIFVFGYVALFGSLMIFLFLAKGLYESGKAVRAYAVRYGSTNSSDDAVNRRRARKVDPATVAEYLESKNTSPTDGTVPAQ